MCVNLRVWEHMHFVFSPLPQLIKFFTAINQWNNCLKLWESHSLWISSAAYLWKRDKSTIRKSPLPCASTSRIPLSLRHHCPNLSYWLPWGPKNQVHFIPLEFRNVTSELQWKSGPRKQTWHRKLKQSKRSGLSPGVNVNLNVNTTGAPWVLCLWNGSCNPDTAHSRSVLGRQSTH